jgi:hypothetical protein
MQQRVLRLLRDIRPFPSRKDTRKRARPIGAQAYVGFCLGAVNAADTVVPSRFNVKYPDLLKAARRLMKAHDPTFRYTSIQVNKNMQCAPHRDKGNAGPSYGIGLGNYTGGKLVVEGTPHVLRNRFVKFDGRKLHYVTPFTGERYTLIYFTIQRRRPTRDGTHGPRGNTRRSAPRLQTPGGTPRPPRTP